jgi:hypothetical protein
MRFFTVMTERPQPDAQERAAMLGHRLRSLNYQQGLLVSGELAYAFRTVGGESAILMYEVQSLENLDRTVKRDPGWPYAETTVTPVVSTESLVREAQEYLGEDHFTEEELPLLVFPRREIDARATYWLAYKEVKPFSPLLSDDDQNDIHRRTIFAQKAHLEPIEFADDNPVGKAVGILVAAGALADVRRHVEGCDVFPDTVVEYKELVPLERAWEATVAALKDLRRPVAVKCTFMQSTNASRAGAASQ